MACYAVLFLCLRIHDELLVTSLDFPTYTIILQYAVALLLPAYADLG